MKKLITITLAAITLFGCVSQKGADGKPGEDGASGGFKILKEETYNGREKESHVLITGQEQLQMLYAELNIQDNTPVIDFNKKSVVAVFSGQKSSGGHSITIKNVSVSKGIAHVKIKKTSPIAGQPASMALTAPYCIAAIPKATTIEITE